jgi:DNA-directed RNA polymerase subunit beta'
MAYMLRTTPGQLLIDQALPPALRRPGRVLDSKGIKALFQELAEKHPEEYRDVAHKLTKLGGDFAFSKGGLSFGIKHLRVARSALAARARIKQQLNSILADRSLGDEDREKRIVELADGHRKDLEEKVFQESLEEGNPLAHQILSGVRGNKMNLRSLRGGDLLYTDHRDRTIPVPVLKSYSEGLSPVEYWAGAFGARKGVIDTKRATADAGFATKQLVQATHRLLTTARDYETPSKHLRGLAVEASDPDNVGALLAHDVGGFKRNTVITPKIMKQLQDKGIARLLVRSPIIGGPQEGGVYARDVGVREKGVLPPTGDYVGIAAAQAIGEKLSQGMLSSKHSGGVAGAGGATSGFKAIERLVNPPKIYPGAAIHSQLDGRVNGVAEAPQGGHFVHVDGKQHYVPEGYEVSVKPGDTVEAGDVMTDGIPNPAEIVRHKGIGEGRRYFLAAMRDTYRNSGMSANRRNIELLARGLIDHVRLTDEHGDYVPDDVVPYSTLEANWESRPGTMTMLPSGAVGKYLESPVLHYSIGTKVRPSMLKQFQEFGVDRLDVHHEPPPFVPEMQRGMTQLQHDPEWATRHLGSGLRKSTLDAVHRGSISDTKGTSYVSALMDPTTFGKSGPTKGWNPADLDEDDLDDDF